MNYGPNLETSPVSPAQEARVVSGCCPRQLGSRGFKRGENPPVGRKGQCDRCCLRWVQDSYPRAGRLHRDQSRFQGEETKAAFPGRGEAGRRGAGQGCLPLAVFPPLAFTPRSKAPQ